MSWLPSNLQHLASTFSLGKSINPSGQSHRELPSARHHWFRLWGRTAPHYGSLLMSQSDGWEKTKNKPKALVAQDLRRYAGQDYYWTVGVIALWSALSFRLSGLSVCPVCHFHDVWYFLTCTPLHMLSHLEWPLSYPPSTLKTPASASRLNSNFTSSWPFQTELNTSLCY